MSHNIYIYILVMAAVTSQVRLSDHFCTMFPTHVWQP